MKLASLKPFPMLNGEVTDAFQVWAGAEVKATYFQLQFRIVAQTPEVLDTLVLPSPVDQAARMNDLWKTTCFECFLPARKGSAYLEFNGSPNGNWNWYAFEGYREGMAELPLPPELQPAQVSLSRSSTEFEVNWKLPMAGITQGLFPGGTIASDLGSLGLSVVLETKDATTYWAVKHGGVKPDFHSKAGFIYDSFRD